MVPVDVKFTFLAAGMRMYGGYTVDFSPSSPLSQIRFFFQAEDGIRDVAVTGVQTCALPISYSDGRLRSKECPQGRMGKGTADQRFVRRFAWARGTIQTEREQSWARRRTGEGRRSEERRVGKEGRSRWSPDH